VWNTAKVHLASESAGVGVMVDNNNIFMRPPLVCCFVQASTGARFMIGNYHAVCSSAARRKAEVSEAATLLSTEVDVLLGDFNDPCISVQWQHPNWQCVQPPLTRSTVAGNPYDHIFLSKRRGRVQSTFSGVIDLSAILTNVPLQPISDHFPVFSFLSANQPGATRQTGGRCLFSQFGVMPVNSAQIWEPSHVREGKYREISSRILVTKP
jgi:endonuclease/exonuclease/phosphatase family metal-dependent hydrolase